MSIIKFEYDIKGKYILLSAYYVLGNMIEILYMLRHLILSTTQVRISFSLFYILVSQQKYKMIAIVMLNLYFEEINKEILKYKWIKIKIWHICPKWLTVQDQSGRDLG